MLADFETVLDKLEVADCNGEKAMCFCPAHDDRNRPSLNIKAVNGKPLMHCFAGCKATEIVAELGLEMGDLFERRNAHRKNLVRPPKTTLLEAKTLPTPTPQREGGLVPCLEWRCWMGP